MAVNARLIPPLVIGGNVIDESKAVKTKETVR